MHFFLSFPYLYLSMKCCRCCFFLHFFRHCELWDEGNLPRSLVLRQNYNTIKKLKSNKKTFCQSTYNFLAKIEVKKNIHTEQRINRIEQIVMFPFPPQAIHKHYAFNGSFYFFLYRYISVAAIAVDRAHNKKKHIFFFNRSLSTFRLVAFGFGAFASTLYLA